MSRIFGEIKQIAYTTRDFDALLAFFVETGIGPWFVARKRIMANVTYRGRATDIEITLGMANSGPLQLEVIEPTSNAKSIYRDWLDKYPGKLMVQHIASWPTDFHATDRRILAAGYESVMSAALPSGAFAYYEHPDHPEFVFETAELTDERRYVWDAIARAAQDWDGQDPVRKFPSLPR
ncbi:MAG TPA: VOC family protein [Rhizomicrobium sp.]